MAPSPGSLEETPDDCSVHGSAEAFARAQLSGPQPYPKYYAFMGRINTLGPEPLTDVDVPEVTAENLRARLADVQVVDARPRAAFAEGHVAGSLGVENGG